MAEGKLAIAIGSLSFSGEGDQIWVTEQFDKFLKQAPDLLNNAPTHIVSPLGGNANGTQPPAQPAGTPKGKVQGTVGAIAAKLSVATGPELIIAAAAKFTLVDGQSSFSRKNLLEAMKTAAHYYKQNYSNNLSASLKRLQQDNRLTEPSTDSFALAAAEKTKLEGLLAG